MPNLLTFLLIGTLGAGTVRAQVPTRQSGPDSLALFLPAPSSRAAPDISLTDQHGRRFSLAEHRGRVVVINFWATWCGPCLREIPDLLRLRAELGAFGLEVVGVSIDAGGWEAVRPYAERLGITYPLVLDDGRTGASFGSSAMMPTTYVADREGMIRLVEQGTIEADTIRPILLALLFEGSACIACSRVRPWGLLPR